MQKAYANIREQVNTCPLSLLLIQEPKLLAYIDSLLPYDTGIEVECSDGTLDSLYNEIAQARAYNEIRFLKEAIFDSAEKRFRVPPGLKGMICLWDISKFLDKYCIRNPQSGIHYHIDFTKEFPHLNTSILFLNMHWMLQSLDKWNYAGAYNKRDVDISNSSSTWIRMQSEHRTMEVRIGEMTFEYELLMKRILNCQRIAQRLKKQIDIEIQLEARRIRIRAENRRKIARDQKSLRERIMAIESTW